MLGHLVDGNFEHKMFSFFPRPYIFRQMASIIEND